MKNVAMYVLGIALITGIPSFADGEVRAEGMNSGGGFKVFAADSTLDDVYTVVEDMPRFSDGALTKWLGENTRYPEAALERGVDGTVFVRFVIEKDGRVTNVEVLRPVDPDLDREAVRVVSSMPRWKPGRQRGECVRVSSTVPIYFRIEQVVEPETRPRKMMPGEVRELSSAPVFMGDLSRWIEYRLQVEDSIPMDAEGQVVVGFAVEPDGRVADLHVEQGMSPEIDRAVLRMMEKMPRWKPGTSNGEPISMEWQIGVNIKPRSEENRVYVHVDEMPKFPGDLSKWVKENIDYPWGMNRAVKGKVFVEFIVEKDGRVTNATVLRSLHPLLDQEAVRVVSSMPRWTPGKRNGELVRVSRTLPINFQLTRINR